MQVGLELAAVEMAPDPRFGVIVQRQRLGADPDPTPSDYPCETQMRRNYWVVPAFLVFASFSIIR